MDLTVTIETKKQRQKGTNKTRVVKRAVPTESFFNFFSPPQIDEDDEEVRGRSGKGKGVGRVGSGKSGSMGIECSVVGIM